MLRVRRGSNRRFRDLFAVCLVTLAGWMTSLAGPARAVEGKWSLLNPTTPPTSFQQIHMVLLPGDGSPYHSRIVTFQDSAATEGAVLGWNEGIAGCDNVAPFSLPVIGSWNPGGSIFCGGHTQLLAGTGAELLSVGGHAFGQGIEAGIPDSRTFAPGTGTGAGAWTARPWMQQARFYPSVTTLADGRAIVTGGQAVEQAWFFGGRVDGNPPATGTGKLLHRYGRGGGWDFAVTPEVVGGGALPTPREGHSAAYLAGANPSAATVYFGGRDSTGNPIAEQGAVWFLRRQDGATLEADYSYQWTKVGPPVGSPFPVARSDHSAVKVSNTEMIVFGGTQTAGQELWRFYKEGNAWLWQTVTVISGTAPTARFGHTAVYQASASRMIVFGGSDTLGGTPTDNDVYAFSFSGGGFSSGSWSKISATSGRPAPRRDHTMVLPANNASLIVYGGHLGGGAPSDTLWRFNLSSAAWSQIATSGSSPGPRANHAAFYDDAGGNRMYIFGGEPAPTAPVDKFTYTIEPLPAAGTATWVQGGEAPNRLSGHTVERDGTGGFLHARRAEIYTRGDNTWSTQSNSGWLPSAPVLAEYPVQFVVSGSPYFGGGGRLLRVGADSKARYLDIPVTEIAAGWQTVPDSVIGFQPQSGVMYEPGKLLVAGSRIDVTNAAKTLDAASLATASWHSLSGLARTNDFNLVILPNGKVLALGGMNVDDPVQHPQLWTPGTDAWSIPSDLVEEPAIRNYHSTAMLLPDGRVLTGGGSGEQGDKVKLYVFCPPYLDTAGEWSGRPIITSAPTSITYGQSFVIGKQTGDNIATACLIRPAATTHGFDQNQRFVPLTLVSESDTTLRAFAPGDGNTAPPGYYLLFTVNQAGVPAVAKWVRLADCPSVPCDHEPPPIVTDLYVDIVGPNEIWLAWSAPGDDRNPALGAYDMRYSTAPITSEKAFELASQVGTPYPPPAPGSQGSGQGCAKDGLAPCTPYYFALKTHDGATNWSAKATLSAGTSCGGGGGGYSAQRVDGSAEGAWASRSPSTQTEGGQDDAATGAPEGVSKSATAEVASLVPASGVLVAETRRAKSGGWDMTLRLVSEAEGFDRSLTGAIVSQVSGAGGAWKTLGRHQVSAGQSPLGLCALRDQGRVVFPAGYQLDRVVSGLREGSQNLALGSAVHSRLGALGNEFIAAGGDVEMALGDVVTFTYAPSNQALPGASSWYLLVRPASGSSAASARRVLDPQIPTQFALRQNQPNPFRGTTRIAFDLPVPSTVTLEVFDLLGRRVVTLAQGAYPAGAHTVDWDVHDVNVGLVRPGVYVCRLLAGSFRAQTKVGVLP